MVALLSEITPQPANIVNFPPLYEVKEGLLHLNYHNGQIEAWNSLARFIFIIAGTQSGKTSWGPFWLAREIEMKGRGDYLAVTSNFDLFKLKFLPSLLEIFEGVLKIGRFWAGERIIEIADPETGKFLAKNSSDPAMYARIILRSAVARGGLESSSAKAAWLDECGQDEFILATWEAVRRRLSLSMGRVLGTTTPYNLGWIKSEIVDRWRAGDPDIDVIRFPSILNPAFPLAEFLDVKKKTAKWKFRMMYLGKFTRPAGMIYEDFIDKDKSHGGHLVDDFPIPSTWDKHEGVDPGSENITKIGIAYDPVSDAYYVYREIHGGKKSTAEHVGDLLDLSLEDMHPILDWFVGAKSESQQRMDWLDAGNKWVEEHQSQMIGPFANYEMDVPEPIITDVEGGIDRVIAVLRLRRIFIFKSCVGLLKDIRNYARKLDKMDLPTQEIEDKKAFHFVDALRYVIAGVIAMEEGAVDIRQAPVKGREAS